MLVIESRAASSFGTQRLQRGKACIVEVSFSLNSLISGDATTKYTNGGSGSSNGYKYGVNSGHKQSNGGYSEEGENINPASSYSPSMKVS